MATPPFTLDETSPGDSDLVSQFPSEQRANLDVIEDWINTEHSTYGHHAIPHYTTAERDAVTTWVIGSLVYNETTGNLQTTTAIDADVWIDVFSGTLEAPSGTRMIFGTTAAPTGWTKDTTAVNGRAIRLASGTVTTGGTAAFTAVFKGHTLTVANLPSTNLGFSLTGPNHSHTMGTHFHSFAGSVSGSTNSDSHNHSSAGDDMSNSNVIGGSGGNTVYRSKSSATTNSDSHSHTFSDSFSGNTGNKDPGNTNNGGTGAVGGSIQLGGSDTAIDLDCQYIDFIIADKD